MDDANRRRAREMTDDLSIWEGPSVSMAVVLLAHMDRVAELELSVANYQRVAEQDGQNLLEAGNRVAEFEGVIGRDAKPGTGKNYESVEIYCQTQSSEMRPGRWSRWPPHAIEDWHLWRPSYRPRAALLDRSAAIREELGVVELEGNGFYMLLRNKGES